MLRIARKLKLTEGAEIAEAALVLPLVFMFLLGIVWFGRAFQIYSTITRAAQQGAITAARPTCATCGSTFSNDTAVENAVFSVMDASSVNHSATTLYMPGGLQYCILPAPAPPSGCTTTSNNVTICRSVVLNSLNPPPSDPQPQQCGTIVSFQYPFEMNLPFTSLNMRQIMLKAQAESRMEN